MNRTSQRKQHYSLVGQLKRCLLIVASLIVSIFLVSIPVGISTSATRYNFDLRRLALQEDQSSLQIFMFDQGTDLRRYITTTSETDLISFKGDRQHYLLAEQDLKNQAQGSDFSHTTSMLVQVEKRADDWYNIYAQMQLANMQSGKLVTARSASTAAVGRTLFDKFLASAAQLQAVIGRDITTLQSRLSIPGLLTFFGIVLLAVSAVIVLWRTLTHFFKALRTQLKVLASATSLLGSGDLSARVQELAYDELNRLGQAFNTMAQDLATRTHELEGTNAEISRQRDELLVLNESLEAANRARSQFLSTMSHELRTPLASIIGFSQLLLDGDTADSLSQQQQGNLERILKNGQHLLGLVSDVLDLEKIEEGAMEIAYSQVDVRDLLTSVVEETESLAITRNLVLRSEVGDGVDFLESNPVKLRQILLNLVSNALKFTEQGGVTVSARRGEADHLIFSVQDTGIGIPAEQQKRIFEAFYQVDGGYTRKSGGTGLGLSIVSQLATLLGGTIELASAPGQGSAFTVTLPTRAIHQRVEPALPRLHARPPQQVSTISSPSAELAPDKLDELLAEDDNQGEGPARAAKPGPYSIGEQRNVVLAVDDNPDVFVLIKSALQDTPYSVVGVQDPLRVMNLAQEMHPIAITLDVMMQGLNGWQLLHQLKENPTTASIPVVMLSVLPEVTTGYVLGADDYLIKPFKGDVLLTTLQRLIASQQERSLVSTRETQPVSKRSR